jgi:hypothetical protein
MNPALLADLCTFEEGNAGCVPLHKIDIFHVIGGKLCRGRLQSVRFSDNPGNTLL